MRTHRSKLLSLALAIAAACGPIAPAEPDLTTATGGEVATSPTTGVVDSTAAVATSTGVALTTGALGDASTGTMSTDPSGPDLTTTSAGPGSSTGDGGVCVADPAQGLCSESCDAWVDCCRCDGKRLKPEDVRGCTVAMGIVAAQCPWNVWDVWWDDTPIIDGWSQSVQDGDIVVEFLGDTCTELLAGNFTEIWLEVFCEAA